MNTERDDKILCKSVTNDIGHYTNIFITNMKHRMKELGVTSGNLAELTGVSIQSIIRYLNGDRTPSGYNIIRLSNALQCTPNDLLLDQSNTVIEKPDEEISDMNPADSIIINRPTKSTNGKIVIEINL